MLIFFILYIIFMVPICLFAIAQSHLAWIARRHRPAVSGPLPDLLPFVTIQLPVYNEPAVVERLLRAVLAIDYPVDKWEVQILDDSTDRTTAIIERYLAKQTLAVPVHHIRRAHRSGYKAGALQNALASARGVFIAFFDADFVPPRDFLQRALPYFQEEKTGFIQTRWSYLNENSSWLTRLQGFFLNAHFAVEQIARSKKGYFTNFNGTAGVWRKSCILDAGGWHSDTLTEDVDLSFRAQLKGWTYRYVHDITCLTELPNDVLTVKKQQYRWNKGGAQCAKKLLPAIWRSNFSFAHKFHATVQLCNSSVFVFVFLSSLCSVPMIFEQVQYKNSVLFNLAALFLLGFFIFIFHYAIMAKRMRPNNPWLYLLRHLFFFLAFSMGLAYSNTRAVISGWSSKGGVFSRTPKVGTQHKKTATLRLHKFQLAETCLLLYFVAAVALGIWVSNYAMLFFHLLLTLGYGSISWYSLYPATDS